MASWSSVDTYKYWKYAVKTDFQGLDDQATELKAINLTYDRCDRFLPFDRSPEEAIIISAINCDSTLLAIVIGSDVDVYDLKTGKQGVFVGHTNYVSEVVFVPGQPPRLVSWSQADDESSESLVPREEIIIWDIKDDMMKDEVVRERTVRVDKASKSSIEKLQSLLDEQSLGIDLSDRERSNMLDMLKRSLNQIIRQRSAVNDVKIDGRLASRFQDPLFSHDGDTLIYLPGSRPRSNGDAAWDIGLYHIPSRSTKTLTGHRDAVVWIGFSPDDSLVVSAGLDETFRVWNAVTGQQEYKWVTDVRNWAGAFRPDGTQFLGTDGTGAIRIWDLQTGEMLAKYERGNRLKRPVAWSSDSRYIAVGEDGAGQILLFDTRLPADESGNMVPIQTRVLDVKAVSDNEMIQHMVSSSLAMRRVTWEGPGRRLFSSTDGEVALEIVDFDLNIKWRILPFEPSDDREADWARLPKSGRRGQPFQPDYSYLASSNEIALISHDGVRFWRL